MSFLLPPDLAALHAAFDHVCNGITYPSDSHAAERFRQAFLAGGAWDQADGWDECFIDHLQDAHWRWPWLDEWRDRFEQIGQAPRMWTAPQTSSFHSKTSRRVPIERDVYLASHSVGASRAQFRKADAYFDHVRFWPVGDEPEAVQQIETSFIDAYRDGSSNLLPPFYPGCRVHMTYVNKRIADRHAADGKAHLIARRR